jgi:hypothetical protein
LLGNVTMRMLFRGLFLALTRKFLIEIQRCSVSLEMSNKIALVSLDFAGTGSMCGGNKRVVGHGFAISRNNNQGLRSLAGNIIALATAERSFIVP